MRDGCGETLLVGWFSGGRGNSVMAMPNDEQPYFIQEAGSGGGDPVTLDF